MRAGKAGGLRHPGSKDRGGMGGTGRAGIGYGFPGTGTQDEVIRQEGYKEWKKKFPGMWTPPQAPEEPYIPPRLILATDLHYQSALAGDGGEAFRLFVERSDGKVVQYLPELLEAFLDEVIEERPSAWFSAAILL